MELANKFRNFVFQSTLRFQSVVSPANGHKGQIADPLGRSGSPGPPQYLTLELNNEI